MTVTSSELLKMVLFANIFLKNKKLLIVVRQLNQNALQQLSVILECYKK